MTITNTTITEQWSARDYAPHWHPDAAALGLTADATARDRMIAADRLSKMAAKKGIGLTYLNNHISDLVERLQAGEKRGA
jgi:hypothetical protein